MPTSEEVFAVLSEIYDPEIPINIVDLGLIYDVKVSDTFAVLITMTLTSQSCPEARTIPEVMKRRVNGMARVTGTEVEIVWEPTWGPHLISEEGRKILGLDEEEEPED